MLTRAPKELALQVIRQRKKLKLSQSAVGQLVGLKQATISSFENNPDGTKLSTVFRILSAVNLDMHVESKSALLPGQAQWTEEW